MTTFWRTGTIAPGSSIERDESEVSVGGAGNAGAVTGRVLPNVAVSERRSRLPITKQRKSLNLRTRTQNWDS